MRTILGSNATRLARRTGTPQPRQLGFRPTAIPASAAALIAQVAVLSLVATAVAGTLGAVAFISATALLFAAAPQTAARDLLRYSPLLLIPAFAMLSTIWSDAPERTMRAGLQLLLTFAAAIMICRKISASSMILMLLLGSTVICLLIVPGIPDALSRRVPLNSALLGSKNSVAYSGHLLVALALVAALDWRQSIIVRLLTPFAIMLGLIIIILAQSGGAQISLAITLITFPAFMMFGRVNLSLRVTILLAALIIAGVALIFLPDFVAAWNDFRVTVLKKDATLTGRTYLWDVAARLSAERPWLGHGYYAFWRHGNIDAEGLWRWGGIASRTGFNFHNAYIEMQVDMGWIGLAALLATSGVIAFLTLMRQVLRPSAPGAFFLSYLIIIYVRGYAESLLILPWNLMALLWIAAAVYSADGLKNEGGKKALPDGKSSDRADPHFAMPRSAERVSRHL